MPSAITAETMQPTSPSAHHRRASLKILSRNIDKVALANLGFSTWYYSPYPDSVIHGPDSTVSSNNGQSSAHIKRESGEYPGSDQHTSRVVGDYGTGFSNTANGISKHDISSNLISKPMLDTLHVCPYCFRYTACRSDYAIHLSLHIKTESDYYTPSSRSHGRRRHRRSNGNISENDNASDDEDDEDSDAPKPVPDTAVKVYSYGGYTVWDVDGEVEKLYCQNLSLFGKLFLEQKSVFFDTAGFHYFVLTYTPPLSPASDMSTTHTKSESTQTSSEQGARSTRGKDHKTAPSPSSSPTTTRRHNRVSSNNTTTITDPMLENPNFPLRHQVLGFFSKENLSWDSNNLACILVFPPYQHRSLGQLLMSVSYKLSGWEWEDSIIGGPEKPLSAMGRKSYLRFWSERIARFIMGQSQDADELKIFEEAIVEEDEDGDLIVTGKRRKRKRGKALLKEELTVKELGDRTGMLAEDVVAALIEMGICDLVISKPKKKKTTSSQSGHQSLTTSPQQQQQQRQRRQEERDARNGDGNDNKNDTSKNSSNKIDETVGSNKVDNINDNRPNYPTNIDTKTKTKLKLKSIPKSDAIQIGGKEGINNITSIAASQIISQNTADNSNSSKIEEHSSTNTDSNDTIQQPQFTTMTINRSRVLDWAKHHKIDMISSVKEEGFLGEWALSEDNDGDEEVDEVDEVDEMDDDDDDDDDDDEGEADADEDEDEEEKGEEDQASKDDIPDS